MSDSPKAFDAAPDSADGKAVTATAEAVTQADATAKKPARARKNPPRPKRTAAPKNDVSQKDMSLSASSSAEAGQTAEAAISGADNANEQSAKKTAAKTPQKRTSKKSIPSKNISLPGKNAALQSDTGAQAVQDQPAEPAGLFEKNTPASEDAILGSPEASEPAPKKAAPKRTARPRKKTVKETDSAAAPSQEIADISRESAVENISKSPSEVLNKATNEATGAEPAAEASTEVAAEHAEGEPQAKHRRSRSRRGRRKSAAAKAAALAAQSGDKIQALSREVGIELASVNFGYTYEHVADYDSVAGTETGAESADHTELAANVNVAHGHPNAQRSLDLDAQHGSDLTAQHGSDLNSQLDSDSDTRQGGLDTRPAARLNTWQAGQTSQKDQADEAEDSAEPDTGKTANKSDKGDKKEAKEAARPKSKMFVSVLPGEQVEVVIASEGQVQEYYVEMLHQAKVKGNIYKGVIHNVDANLQAAFVSYGAVKNGFLQIDEVHPEYYLAPHEVGKGHKYPLIQKVLKPGQEILVQVVKEPAGTKGAFLTSYLSLPGRFLVLTPGREQIGVSRKVDSEEERARLRDLLSGLNPGEGMGVIVRTVSRGATKTSLMRDLQQLKRLWKDVRKKGSTEQSPCLIYQELGLDTRAVRDYLTEDVSELWVDDEDMAAQLREIVSVLFPRRSDMVHVHNDVETSLFERFSLKKQLEQVHSREVTLPSGGRLVIDHTEALVAIDINSGRAAGKNNFEDTAYKTNLEAAQMIPLQLRLRDIGGQIVIDFIEMRDRNHWREVEKAIRNGMKIDRARHDVGKISSFGLLEIVRQRLSSSAISVTSEPCPCCKGTGQRRNMEWQSQQALREIRALLRKSNETGSTVVYSNATELVMYLLNHKRERLLEMERAAGVKLELRMALEENGKK